MCLPVSISSCRLWSVVLLDLLISRTLTHPNTTWQFLSRPDIQLSSVRSATDGENLTQKSLKPIQVPCRCTYVICMNVCVCKHMCVTYLICLCYMIFRAILSANVDTGSVLHRRAVGSRWWLLPIVIAMVLLTPRFVLSRTLVRQPLSP